MIYHPSRRVQALVAMLTGAALIASVACKKTPTTPTNLNIPFSATDIIVGTGTEAVTGATIITHYNAYLYDPRVADQKGQLFDSTLFSNVPFYFVLGAHTTIIGFERGIEGMRVGGVRRLEIPPELGYGAFGSGPVPGNATLIFDVEVVGVTVPVTTTTGQ